MASEKAKAIAAEAERQRRDAQHAQLVAEVSQLAALVSQIVTEVSRLAALLEPGEKPKAK